MPKLVQGDMRMVGTASSGYELSQVGKGVASSAPSCRHDISLSSLRTVTGQEYAVLACLH